MLPRTTKLQRLIKRNADNANGHQGCAYNQMLKDVSHLYALSVKENNSRLPAVAPRWSTDAITRYVKLESHKLSKDERVSYLARALDIGAVNTLEACKVIFEFPKKYRISY
jgi:hypothetical protein